MGGRERRLSDRITVRWPSRVGHYRAEYLPSMLPPHRNVELIDALSSLRGVISVQTMNNLKGLYINVHTRSSSDGRYAYNAIYGVFKRLDYELIENTD